MSFWRKVGKAAVTGLVEAFASAAGSHIADRLLAKSEDPITIEMVDNGDESTSTTDTPPS